MRYLTFGARFDARPGGIRRFSNVQCAVLLSASLRWRHLIGFLWTTRQRTAPQTRAAFCASPPLRTSVMPVSMRSDSRSLRVSSSLRSLVWKFVVLNRTLSFMQTSFRSVAESENTHTGYSGCSTETFRRATQIILNWRCAWRDCSANQINHKRGVGGPREAIEFRKEGLADGYVCDE